MQTNDILSHFDHTSRVKHRHDPRYIRRAVIETSCEDYAAWRVRRGLCQRGIGRAQRCESTLGDDTVKVQAEREHAVGVRINDAFQDSGHIHIEGEGEQANDSEQGAAGKSVYDDVCHG